MKPTFVVADDHPLVLAGVKEVLRQLDPETEILEAYDYPSLLEVLDQDHDFLLVIADLNMPGMDGLSGIRAVQAKRPDVPIVVMSATENSRAISKTMECGAVGYMFKSYNQQQMLKVLTLVLDGECYVPENHHATSSKAVDQTSPDFGLATLNHLPFGVAIVDEEMSILFVNKVADEILKKNDGLSIDGKGCLRTSLQEETKGLRELLARAHKGKQIDTDDCAMSVTRPSQQRSLALTVAPVMKNSTSWMFADNAVSIFITDPEKHHALPAAMLGKLFSLTDAESRLLQALIAGRRLENVAEDSGVSMNTLRSHLKQIFRKTGTNRQPELISLVLNSAAVIASVAGTE